MSIDITPYQTTELRLLGHRIHLSEAEPGLDWEPHCLGRCSLTESRVVLRAGLSDDLRRSTALHELTHLVSDLLQLGLSEQQVDGVAIGLYSLMQDSPAFMREMLGGQP